jgi:hypothetical protein
MSRPASRTGSCCCPRHIRLLEQDPDPQVRARAVELVGLWVHTSPDRSQARACREALNRGGPALSPCAGIADTIFLGIGTTWVRPRTDDRPSTYDDGAHV